MKTMDEKYRDKLLFLCEKAPEYLTLEIHRMLHENTEEGYIYFMNEFIDQVHLIVGKNIPQLCLQWAKAILDCKDMHYATTTADNGPPGD